jgi:hypothetical protein
MPRIPLTSGAYSAASLIANAQRSVNLYPESNPQETTPPVQVTQYPRPGLTLLSSPPTVGFGRGLYVATNGKLFAVINQNVYHIHYEDNWEFHLVGTMQSAITTPVLAADNGVDALFLDNTLNGYSVVIDTATGHQFNQIGDPNFLGGTRPDFIDSFLITNQPNTKNWYSTLSGQLVFNGLYIGVKTAWPDNIQCVISVERAVWVLGKYKSELWYNAGAVPFPFQIQPGLIIEHGCAAPYSAAKQDVNCYWLSQSPEGARMVMKGTQNIAQRISNHAIEAEFVNYPRVDDAIGSVFQINGHAFYCLDFPTADKTWVYDEATKQWHQWTHIDTNGMEHRCLTPFKAYAYGINVGLDWQNGNLYKLDEENFTDNDSPIAYIRSFPHVEASESQRITVWKFVADMQVGAAPGTSQVPTTIEPPLVSLRVSRDRGASWGNAVMVPLGAQGQYLTRPTWNRLGYMADAVFELSWSTPLKTALNGAFIEVEKHDADL